MSTAAVGMHAAWTTGAGFSASCAHMPCTAGWHAWVRRQTAQCNPGHCCGPSKPRPGCCAWQGLNGAWLILPPKGN